MKYTFLYLQSYHLKSDNRLKLVFINTIKIILLPYMFACRLEFLLISREFGL